MKTLKGIALLIGFCAFGAAAFLFVTVGILCLALRDGFMAIVHRLNGQHKRYQPKVFYGGRDGVPNLVMDADGFVEPPQRVIQPETRRHVGHIIPADSALLGYNKEASWRHGVAAVGVMQPGGEVKILEFPMDPVERQRLIDSRPQPADHDTLGGDTLVFLHGKSRRES